MMPASLRKWTIPGIFTLCTYPFFYLSSLYILDFAFVKINWSFLWPDIFCQLIIGYILFGITQKSIFSLPMHGLLMAIIYPGSAIKITFLGSPIVLTDLTSIDELFKVFSNTTYSGILWTSIAFVSILFLLTFTQIKKSIFLSLSGLSILAFLLFLFPEKIHSALNIASYYKPWNPTKNFISQGGTIFLIHQSAIKLTLSNNIPTINEVNKSLEYLSHESQLVTHPGKNIISTPNIFFIMLESFGDPELLLSDRSDTKVFQEDFLQQWKQNGRSWAASPTLGGVTCQAEFELLTGLPANLNNEPYIFENFLKNKLNALPKILQDNGYTTIASHPNDIQFWNRANVYPRLGFELIYSKKDFKQDDMNGPWLSDQSLYEQTIAKIDSLPEKTPKFIYILTGTGHYPYVLNHKKRPKLKLTKSKKDILEKYANSIYYSSAELIGFIKTLHSKDPQAIIVVLGDHPPRPLEDSIFSEDSFTPYLVPLIMLEGGKRIAVPQIISTYNIAEIILNILGVQKMSPLFYLTTPGRVIRPLQNGSFLLFHNHETTSCDNRLYSFSACKNNQEWTRNATVLIADSVYGNQFFRQFTQ